MNDDDEDQNHVIIHQFISFNVKKNNWDSDLFLQLNIENNIKMKKFLQNISHLCLTKKNCFGFSKISITLFLNVRL